jgi:hypothetical protein
MRDAWPVRTTLDLDVDILQAAKELAAAKGSTLGKVVSELARKALESPRAAKVRNGVRSCRAGRPVHPKPTMKQVNDLRDDG